MSAPADGSGLLEHSAFEIQREIGRGGMATIYLAVEKAPPHRKVALKVVHPHLAGDEQLVERFRHEVRAHVGLDHPNVVRMFGWGRDPGGNLFIAMEHVDGPTLKDVLATTHPLPLDVAVFVVRGMLLGLRFAHDAGLVHRDVKPANVMLTREGVVKIADFGIAKTDDMTRLTSTGLVIGTPAYMSPEQALAKPLDRRSDLFSVGVVLYEMVSGLNPFSADNPATTLSRIVQHQQRPAFETVPHLPAVLEDVLERLLQKDVDRRAAAEEPLVADLDRLVKDEGLSSDSPTLAAFLADPEGTSRRLDAARAQRHLDRGVKLHGFGPANSEAALWDFFLATVLDPGNAEARTWLEQLSSERGYSLHRRSSQRIDELERKLAGKPDDLATILQLAKLHKAQGNFLEVVFHYRRAKALKPPDRYTRGQIDTLVSPQAVPVIDGMGVDASQAATLVARSARKDGARGGEVEPRPGAEGVTDFLAGVLSTRAGRVALALSVVVILVGTASVLVGRGSGPSGGRGGSGADDAAPPEGTGEDEAEAMLDRAAARSAKGEHGKAEELYRRYVDENPRGARASEALFELGDALERQGRRTEALAIHERNAAENDDAWAARSLGRRGELLLVEGDHASARAAYEQMAQVAAGDLELEGRLGVATVLRAEGRTEAAIAELETLVPEARGEIFQRAALDLADLLAETGERSRAEDFYRRVRDVSDHQGPAYRRAEDGLLAVQAAGQEAPIAQEAPPAEEVTEPVEDTSWYQPAPEPSPEPPDGEPPAEPAPEE